MDVTITAVGDLPPDAYRRLYQLNFRGGSQMQQKLSMARHGKIDGHVAVCAIDSVVAGWCLIWRDYASARYPMPIVYFYVKHRARRRGVGTALLSSACKFCVRVYGSRPAVWAHDDTSTSFFDGADCDILVYYPED